MQPVPFRIGQVTEEQAGCFTFRLEALEGQAGLSFRPGQFNMLYAFGHGEVPISMSGDPADQETLVHTIRVVGPVTRALRKLEAGQTVGIRGPFGSSWPLEDAVGKDVLIMVGGIGLAPLRPVIYHLLSNAGRYGRLSLLYGTRTPDMILYPQELLGWTNKINVSLTVDSARQDWHGHVGVVTDLLNNRDIDPDNTIAMLCGPEIMMRFCAYALQDRGLAASRIYVSMERNMKCALGLCGRCQYGPYFICKDGPVFSFDRVEHLFRIREL